MYSERSLIFGPVVEKPNKTAFITRDPTDLILNGEFSKVPILAGYTNHEGLLFELIDRCKRALGANISTAPPNPQELIPIIMKTKMDESNFDQICSEMENAYSMENMSLKKCLVSMYCITEYCLKKNNFFKIITIQY